MCIVRVKASQFHALNHTNYFPVVAIDALVINGDGGAVGLADSSEKLFACVLYSLVPKLYSSVNLSCIFCSLLSNKLSLLASNKMLFSTFIIIQPRNAATCLIIFITLFLSRCA